MTTVYMQEDGKKVVPFREDIPESFAREVILSLREDYSRRGWKVEYDAAAATLSISSYNSMQAGVRWFLGKQGKIFTVLENINAETPEGEAYRLRTGSVVTLDPNYVTDKSAGFVTAGGQLVYVDHRDSKALKENR